MRKEDFENFELPDYVVTKQEAINYYGSIEIMHQSMQKIGTDLSRSTNSYYQRCDEEGDKNPALPPLFFFHVIDTAKKYEGEKAGIVVVEIPTELFSSRESQKMLPVFLASEVANFFAALKTGQVEVDENPEQEISSTSKILGIYLQSEAFMVRMDNEELEKSGGKRPDISTHPNKQEVYMLALNTIFGKGIMSYPINHNKEGIKFLDEKPTQNVFNVNEDSSQVESNMMLNCLALINGLEKQAEREGDSIESFDIGEDDNNKGF